MSCYRRISNWRKCLFIVYRTLENFRNYNQSKSSCWKLLLISSPLFGLKLNSTIWKNLKHLFGWAKYYEDTSIHQLAGMYITMSYAVSGGKLINLKASWNKNTKFRLDYGRTIILALCALRRSLGAMTWSDETLNFTKKASCWPWED